MKQVPKYNLEYCGEKIKDALRKAARGTITMAEASAIIQDYGRKIGQTETVYSPDEVLDFSKRIDS